MASSSSGTRSASPPWTEPLLAPCLFDQDVPHGLGRRQKRLTPALKPLPVPALDVQVGLVDQRGRNEAIYRAHGMKDPPASTFELALWHRAD